MNTIPLICKIFGHKYIHEITQKYYLAEIQSSQTLDYPRCKRCGIKMNINDKIKELK